MKKIILFLSAFALLLNSCSHDIEPNMPPSDNPTNPTDPGSILLKKMIETDQVGDVFTANYFYDGNKLNRIEDEEGFVDKYFYTGNLVTKIEYYDDTNTLYLKEEFVYNASEQLISFQGLEYQGGLGFKETYTYDVTGNNITIDYYDGDLTSQTNHISTGNVTFSNGEIASMKDKSGITYTYTYDSKNSPMKNVIGLNKLSFYDSGNMNEGVNHNVLAITKSDGESIINTMTYNSNDYPATLSVDDSVLSNPYSFQLFY